jgi:hypothetical protein
MSANDAPANDAYYVCSCKHSVTTVAVNIRPRIDVSRASASRIRRHQFCHQGVIIIINIIVAPRVDLNKE